jgi:membrane carboxypeptidase/penicillin-binding protein PbpC
LLTALVVILALLRCWPHAPLADRMPLSSAVWSADGELLRVTLSADEQYRMWASSDEMSPELVEAVLLKEDRWFYWHPGVNPVALIRAAFRTYVAGDRQGGSTITMQLARLAFRLNTRTAAGKARQIGAALWLEARYSKRQYSRCWCRKPHLLRQSAESTDAWRSADAGGHSAAPGAPGRPIAGRVADAFGPLRARRNMAAETARR